MERVLVQIVLADRQRAFQCKTVSVGERIDTDKLYDFVQFVFFLQKTHGSRNHGRPVRGNIPVVPLFEPVKIQGIRLQPIDCGEVSRVGKFCGKAPVHFDDTKRRLGNRFRDIATRR